MRYKVEFQVTIASETLISADDADMAGAVVQEEVIDGLRLDGWEVAGYATIAVTPAEETNDEI